MAHPRGLRSKVTAPRILEMKCRVYLTIQSGFRNLTNFDHANDGG